jgi:uncharacterized protein involved in outer membrane biogenesis
MDIHTPDQTRFRDKRVVLKYIGYGIITLAALLIFAVAGVIALLESDYLRGRLASAGSSKIGRELSIAGPFDIQWGWRETRVHAEQVSISNAPEFASEHPNMLEIGSADFTVKLSKLLIGRLELPEVTLSNLKLVLERADEKNANWKFPALTSGHIAAETIVPDARSNFPIIGEFTINGGNIIFKDAVKNLDMDLKLSSLSGGGGSKKIDFNMNGDGTISGKKFKLDATGGSLTSLRDTDKPYPLQLSLVMGETEVALNGTFMDPLKVEGVDTDISLKGPNLADLYYLTSIPLPPTPAYNLTGHLVKEGNLWHFDIPKGQIGNSDAKATGSYDVSGERGLLKAEIESQKMYMDDLGGFIGLKSKGKETVAPSTRFFPDVPIDLSRMRKSDLDVTLTAHSLDAPGWPFDSLKARFNLDQGLLKVDPIEAGIASGTMTGSLILDGRKDVPHLETDIMLRRLSMKRFFENTRFASLSSGRIGGRFVLVGDGKSLAEVLSGADGRTSVMMAGGQISQVLVEAAGLDVAQITPLLLNNDKTTNVRCGVADFGVKDGLLTSDIFELDTGDSHLSGNATINLQSETIDAQMESQPKDISPMTARTPIRISGPLKKPSVSINPEKLAMKAGAAVVLALLNPLAAVIPFIDTGGGEDADCRALIREVRARYDGDIAGPAASEAPAMVKAE